MHPKCKELHCQTQQRGAAEIHARLEGLESERTQMSITSYDILNNYLNENSSLQICTFSSPSPQVIKSTCGKENPIHNESLELFWIHEILESYNSQNVLQYFNLTRLFLSLASFSKRRNLSPWNKCNHRRCMILRLTNKLTKRKKGNSDDFGMFKSNTTRWSSNKSTVRICNS